MAELFPVIHYFDSETTLANASIALQAGCKGVVLINMRCIHEELDNGFKEIKRHFPELLVFINRLGCHDPTQLVSDMEMGLNGTWVDNPGVSSAGITPYAEELTVSLRNIWQKNPDYLFFGSVAFKTQEDEPEPARAAKLAKELGWIVTTSGVGTGIAPDLEKVILMKQAIGSHPLAIASGITPDNVDPFLPSVDYYLVATGISEDFYHFSAHKTTALAQKIMFR